MLTTINGFSVRTPTSCQFGLVPFFGATTMTTQDGKTLSGVTKWKRKLIFQWTDIPYNEAKALLNAIYASPYKAITYNDPCAGTEVTKAFYLEDEQTMPVKHWGGKQKYFSEISFTFVERECSDDINE